jgi:hypothetical protein
MNAAAARGEIKQSVVDEFNQASKDMKLPEHAETYKKKIAESRMKK